MRRSFTLIECAAAIVVLGVGMVPLMQSFVDAASQTRHVIQASVASFLATERMEQIVAARYRDAVGYTRVTTANFPNESSISGFTTFARTVTVQTVNNALAASGSDIGLKLVTVTVTWNGGTSQMRVARIFGDF
ncbi:MAG: prepilin-type N-terminal cleavage/methylation domain-containing protein [Phycisphaerae bacterium]